MDLSSLKGLKLSAISQCYLYAYPFLYILVSMVYEYTCVCVSKFISIIYAKTCVSVSKYISIIYAQIHHYGEMDHQRSQYCAMHADQDGGYGGI